MALTTGEDGMIWKWLGVDVLWKISAGVAVGWVVGKIGSRIAFGKDSRPRENGEKHDVENGSEGLLVIAALLIAYGVGELSNGYGFLSVFVAAVTAKQREITSDLHKKTHGFIDQIERVVMVIILIGFGGLLASGVLNSLTWPGVIVGFCFLFLVRPLTGLLGMAGSGLPFLGKFAVAFLGVRGVGSFYYLAYGQHHASFAQLPQLWSAISFVVLLSVVTHGICASKLLKSLSKGERVVKQEPVV